MKSVCARLGLYSALQYLQCMRGIFYNVLLEEIVGANLFEV